MVRYDPLYLKVFPTPETRPLQRETLIELYRRGKITEAFRAFKKIYLEVVDQLIDHLKSQEAGDSSARVSKEVIAIHALLTRSLFGDGIPRRLLLRVSLAKLTSAPLRF